VREVTPQADRKSVGAGDLRPKYKSLNILSDLEWLNLIGLGDEGTGLNTLRHRFLLLLPQILNVGTYALEVIE